MPPGSMPDSKSAPLTAHQLFQGVCQRTESWGYQPEGIGQLPPSFVRHPTAGLVDLVQMLCAPDSGWPATRPLTPATLLPYVSDEVEELLEALHQWQQHRLRSEADKAPFKATAGASPRLELLSTWATDLVWSIATSTPDAMALLEGLPLPSSNLPRPQNLAGVRLVPVLTLHLKAAVYTLDLTTQSVFDPKQALPDDWLLDLNQGADSSSWQPLRDWREQLWVAMGANVPTLSRWQQGQDFSILVPGCDWAQAQGCLSLEWVACAPHCWIQVLPETTVRPASATAGATAETTAATAGAMPTPQVWSAPAVSWPEVSPHETSHQVAPASYPTLDTDMAFSDSAWRQDAIAATLSIDIAAVLGAYPQSQGRSPDADTVMQVVYHAVSPGQLYPRGLRQMLATPLTLAELATQVQWLWVRANWHLMGLMQGMAAHCLQPEQGWQPGTLVATGQLVFGHGPDQSWQLDLSSRQWQATTGSPLETAIVHLVVPYEGRCLWSATALQASIGRSLQQRSPVLARLLTGTTVELNWPAHQAPPSSALGTTSLCLQVMLAFTPSETATAAKNREVWPGAAHDRALSI